MTPPGAAAEPQGEPQTAEPPSEPAAPVSPGTEPQGAPEPDRSRTYSYDDMHEIREEAKKYRHRLRQTEQAREELQARVDVHDRMAVTRIAGEHLADGDDLMLVHEIAEFRAEDGSLNDELVREAAKAAVSARPYWAKQGSSMDGGVRRAVEPKKSFGEALKNRATGSG